MTCPVVTGSISDLVNNGEMFAFLAWRQNAPLYRKLGLLGPTLESLGISPAPQRKGVEVELHF